MAGTPRRSVSSLAALLALIASLTAPQATWAHREAGRQPSASVFSEPAAGAGPVVSLLGSARRSIKLEVYELSDKAVVDALVRARRRRVEVRVILEEHPDGGSTIAKQAFSQLRDDGIAVRWANEKAFTYTHEKAVDVDDRLAGIFTLNLTYSGLGSNREFGVIDRNAKDASEIGSIFDADWSRRPFSHLKDARLVVSPINSRVALTDLVDGARHTLELYEEEMDDSSFEHHLIQAVHRHVKVRLLTSNGGSGVDLLRARGVQVELLPHPYIHAKAILADGSRLFVGSENISATSLDHNREMGVILTQPGAVAVVAHSFARDWKSAGPPSGAHGSLKLSVSTSPRSVHKGQRLTVEARTTSGASCTIQVTYPDGYVSHAPELQGSRTAGPDAEITWSWHVDSTATGKAHAAVDCRLGNAHLTRTAAFTITS